MCCFLLLVMFMRVLMMFLSVLSDLLIVFVFFKCLFVVFVFFCCLFFVRLIKCKSAFFFVVGVVGCVFVCDFIEIVNMLCECEELVFIFVWFILWFVVLCKNVLYVCFVSCTRFSCKFFINVFRLAFFRMFGVGLLCLVFINKFCNVLL